MTEPSTQDYLIILRNGNLIPLRLELLMAQRIADDWKNECAVGAYTAFNEANTPFTAMLRFSEIAAITGGRLAFTDGSSTTASSMLTSLRDSPKDNRARSGQE